MSDLISAARATGDAVGAMMASVFEERARQGFESWAREQSAGIAALKSAVSGVNALIDSAPKGAATGGSGLTAESVKKAYDRR